LEVGLPPLEWSEGLTLAAKDYADAWAEEESAPSLEERANKFGRFPSSAQLVESVFEFKAFELDPVDFTRLILTNDGSNE